MPADPSLFRRTLLWFLLALLGNIAIVALSVVASTPPANLPPLAVLHFLHPFAAPMYSPELLFFTSVLGALSGLRMAKGEADDDAARLIAWGVRVTLAFVLSFAVVIVVVTPHRLAIVLFAVLLGYVTFVLAEHMTPPKTRTLKERLRSAQEDLAAREGWAAASLGQGWRKTTSRSGLRFALFAVIPMVVQMGLSLWISSIIWGPSAVWSAQWIAACAMMTFGMLILTAAWLMGADKAEAPQLRAWLTVSFAALGAGASAALAIVFFTESADAAPLGWLILGMSAVWALVLWNRRFRPSALIDVAVTLTARHLDRTSKHEAALRAAWEAEKTGATS